MHLPTIGPSGSLTPMPTIDRGLRLARGPHSLGSPYASGSSPLTGLPSNDKQYRGRKIDS